ncbi:g10903 [Coccomyxa elongata]
MNYNVKLALWWTLFENASASLRSGDIFSAFIYLYTNSNSTVGYIQGINGILQLLTAPFAGYLADKFRRDAVLRVAATIGLVAGLTLAASMYFQGSVWHFFLAMALMGTYKGFNNPAVESIFADSVQTGKSKLYTWKHVITSLSSAVGPIVSVVLFFILGNQWKVDECRFVLLFGLTFMVLPLSIMCFFNDDRTLGDISEAASPLLNSEQLPIKAESGNEELETQQSCCSSAFLVPALITFSDFIASLASGMTIKFFALFFMQKCGLSPVTVSILSAVSPIFVSAGSLAAQSVSQWCGKVPVTLVTRACDIGLLVTMAFLPTDAGPLKAVLLVAHLLRKACANCTRPLMRSILMEHVPKRHRGKVNALDSVRTFSWSGSSAAGGILIERFGFQTTFLITACIKTVSFVPLLMLLFVLREGPQRSSCLPLWRTRKASQVPQQDGGEAADDNLRASLISRTDQQPDAVSREER